MYDFFALDIFVKCNAGFAAEYSRQMFSGHVKFSGGIGCVDVVSEMLMYKIFGGLYKLAFG